MGLRTYWKSEEYINSRKERAQVIYSLIGDRLLNVPPPYLSIGSGPGILERELGNLLGKDIFCVEIDKDVIVERSNTVVGDGCNLPFKDATFNFVLLNHVVEHVGDVRGLISEVKRVLRDGGMVYVATPNLLWPYEVHYKLPFVHWFPKKFGDYMVRITRRGRGFEGVSLLSYRGIKVLFEREGFEIFNLLPKFMFEKRSALRKRWWKVATATVKYLPLIKHLLTTHISPQHTFIAVKK